MTDMGYCNKVADHFWWSKDECLCLSEAPFVLGFFAVGYTNPKHNKFNSTVRTLSRKQFWPIMPPGAAYHRTKLEAAKASPRVSRPRHRAKHCTAACRATAQSCTRAHCSRHQRPGRQICAGYTQEPNTSDEWLFLRDWRLIRCRSDLIFDDPIWTSSGFSGSQTSTLSPAQSSPAQLAEWQKQRALWRRFMIQMFWRLTFNKPNLAFSSFKMN